MLRDIIEGTKQDIEAEVTSWHKHQVSDDSKDIEFGVYCTISIKLNTDDNSFTQLIGFLATDSDLRLEYISFPCYTLGFTVQSAAFRRWIERKSDLITYGQRDLDLRNKLLDTWWQHVFVVLPCERRFTLDLLSDSVSPQHCEHRGRQNYVEYNDGEGHLCVIYKNLISFGIHKSERAGHI